MNFALHCGKNQISFCIFPDLDKRVVCDSLSPDVGFEWLFLPSPYPKIFTIVNDFSKYSVRVQNVPRTPLGNSEITKSIFFWDYN